LAWRSVLKVKFHPHMCNDKAEDPKTENLTEMLANFRIKMYIPCAIFTKVAEFVPHFKTRQLMDLLKGLQSWGGFKLMDGFPLNFQRSPVAKLCTGPPNVFNVLEVLYHRAKFGVVRISPLPPPRPKR